VLLLVRVWFRDRDERIRAAGLLACMASVVTMGFAAAWGRGYSNEVAGFATRYVMLPASILCACWFAWSRYAWAPIAACVQFALAFTLCVALPINASAGNDFAVSRGRVAVSLERDVNAGIPIRELSHIYADSVYPGAPDLDARLRVLDRMHFAPFTNRPSEADPVMTQLDQVMAAMRRPPAGMRSARPIVTTTVDGVPVIVVRPPGELRFDPVPDRRAVRGRFGMLPASWAVEGNASVTFTVERIAYAGERRVLFERTLDPVRNAGDRGLQIFHVALPDDAIGQIVLRTSLPPDANPMIAWSYWAEMRFEEMPVDSDGR